MIYSSGRTDTMMEINEITKLLFLHPTLVDSIKLFTGKLFVNFYEIKS
jgi:hypothetical protein